MNAPAPTRTIVLLACAAFASMASMRVCDSMLPSLARGFDVTTGHAAYTISAFAVAYGLVQLGYGYLGDRFSKIRIATIATAVCAVCSIACALAWSLKALVVMRILAGATAGGIIPLSLAWIGDTVPYEQRQATLARFLSGNLFGQIGGQLIGGALADTFGWRWAFAVLACVFSVVAVLLWAQLRGAALTVAASTHAQQQFVGRVASVLKLPWARVILLTVFCEGVVGFAALAFVPAYLHARFGLSLTAAGAVLAVFGLGGLLYILFARRLIARLGEAGLALRGGWLVSFAFLLLAIGPRWGWALPACVLAGVGLYMLHNTLQANATQMAPHARGTGVALFATVLFFGQSIGVAFGAMLIDHVGARWIFVVAAIGLAVIGVLVSRALRRRTARHLEARGTMYGSN